MTSKKVFYIAKQDSPESFEMMARLVENPEINAVILEGFLNGSFPEWVPPEILKIVKSGKPVFLIPEGPGHVTDDGRRLGVMDFDYSTNIEAYKSGGMPLENSRSTDFFTERNPMPVIESELKIGESLGLSSFEIARNVQNRFLLKEEDISDSKLWQEILRRRSQISEFQANLESNFFAEKNLGELRK